MSSTDTNNIIVPPPPRLTGNYQADSVIISDYMQALFNAIAPQLDYAEEINQALGTAGVSGFPLDLGS